MRSPLFFSAVRALSALVILLAAQESARAQLDVTMPQLKLLLDARAVEAITGSAKPASMTDADLDGTKCHRVSVKGPAGTSVLWISADENLLLKASKAAACRSRTPTLATVNQM